MKIKVALALLMASASVFAQTASTVSLVLQGSDDQLVIPYAGVELYSLPDSMAVFSTLSDTAGIAVLSGVNKGKYYLKIESMGYEVLYHSFYNAGNVPFLDLGRISLHPNHQQLNEVVVSGRVEGISQHLEKKVYQSDVNISASGGSVLTVMNNLPGVTVKDGALMLRGSNRVTVLIDGNQTALTGFGNQRGLDNLPASAVDHIEIINNPSAGYDANGHAGIINIVLKKEQQYGWNGQVGLSAGLGALWERKANIADIRPQYQRTPKVNPSLNLNYRAKKVNFFFQFDDLYTETLNKNEFTTRTYDDGTVINQQMKRNRNTNFIRSSTGLDWYINPKNTLTWSASYSRERIMDYGDQPFVNDANDSTMRWWKFLEDEKVTAFATSLNFEHQFSTPGHKLKFYADYTFDREDEKYFFDNITPTFTGNDSFKLIADQQIFNAKLNYFRPMRNGLLELGAAYRKRDIPTNMQFFPGVNSPLDTNADGKATYLEDIPAVFANYTLGLERWEAEVGLRIEYVKLNYIIAPGHNTYSSNGYEYLQLFPNARVSYKINEKEIISLFFNRRVDRPDEEDIRIFPKYDDAQIIKVGNPALKPQFTNSTELGYRKVMERGSLYGALYYRQTVSTITRIATVADSSNFIYNVTQNAGGSRQTGVEVVFDYKWNKHLSTQFNVNAWQNVYDAYTIVNLYPVPVNYSSPKRELYSGSAKGVLNYAFGGVNALQVSAIYLAPDLLPQGRIEERFSVDVGYSRKIWKSKGEFFVNARDLFNTLVTRTTTYGDSFQFTSVDYKETQVITVGVKYKF